MKKREIPGLAKQRVAASGAREIGTLRGASSRATAETGRVIIRQLVAQVGVAWGSPLRFAWRSAEKLAEPLG